MIIRDSFVIGVDYCVRDDRCWPGVTAPAPTKNIQRGRNRLRGFQMGVNVGESDFLSWKKFVKGLRRLFIIIIYLFSVGCQPRPFFSFFGASFVGLVLH